MSPVSASPRHRMAISVLPALAILLAAAPAAAAGGRSTTTGATTTTVPGRVVTARAMQPAPAPLKVVVPVGSAARGARSSAPVGGVRRVPRARAAVPVVMGVGIR